jgi:hypothetical protein
MILSRSHHFIFVHVPKTAGTAVHHCLSRFTGPDDIAVLNPPEEVAKYYGREFNLRKHATASEILESIGEDEFNQLFKFAFVRNPFTRCYSLYRFLKHKFRSWDHEAVMDRLQGFEDFVASEFFRSPGPDRILSPQSLWLSDQNGSLLVDRVGRIERLDSDLADICSSIGLTPSLRLEPANVSGTTAKRNGPVSRLSRKVRQRLHLLKRPDLSPPLPEIGETTRRTIAERYDRDFEAFGYTREWPVPVLHGSTPFLREA